MVINKNELNRYFKAIRKKLKFSFNIKNQVMKSFKNQVYEFIEENDNASMVDIVNEFGDCHNISLNLKDEELNYYKKKARIMFVLEIITIIIIILLIVYIVIFINTLGHGSHITIKKE